MSPVAAVKALFWRLQRPVVDRARASIQDVGLRRGRNHETRPNGPLAQDHAAPVLDHLARHRLRQPDRHTCASSSMVALRMLRHPERAEEVLGSADPGSTFAREAKGVLRRTNAWLDARGRPQLPWPLRWGSRPAGLVRLLDAPEGYGARGRRYRNRVVDPHDPAPMYDAILAEVKSGEPVLLFVGDRRWFKHTVLVVRATVEELSVYEPAGGRIVPLERAAFLAGEMDAGGWRTAWLALLPD